ncbi:MAG: bifunctional 2-polyprenyl-6-hydroxyphenol methylase/3-demethylubiquinol 3-O-methyltransferase UbiG [Rhodospirillaceae bacterium]|mgnify:CR=1 FL=1|jgi:2-polyprenyl-6-hydroxyphenyl methylase / 3-demethylubiquinone-9 3-methyltransferase|nr:bifunctional 2-polyprenyl-6-hydroxyphenol methylase/3-demethylubiquinol 3-O-methyltransferase UbiG [Rhodospirillaceae bacterium]MBT5244004.1 bifunctional 2-polyprenyl-6-hydroxyphenol methylase/3-demethylubiquinol 3-O-methyltransferase UbiG [Rhodospirillaceae bacterium]MBT5560824.1 bifunctional 2-polyprenyl-6-hydroxyphenol methylase/3-demethylubiquinol 3-O-methyltransferase UbiG [Rhodospirillaceae bacterium]MBT6240562.1 bifunctional 2-polyprenyl-6-hydroxyphenol methylase/3-demethylubiquinol 3-
METDSKSTTASPEEVARFTAMAETWWDANGKFRPLHQINPVRIAYIRDFVCAHFNRDPMEKEPFKGLELIDIGCGGGLLCEPMARLGANVSGIDAGDKNIAIASLHAQQGDLDINYRQQLPEELVKSGKTFDVVLNMEVIEHVADVDAFLAASAALVKPGGVMVLSTLNRTLKAFALAKVGAEYIMRWLPTGTHDWRKFVKPSELARGLKTNGVEVSDIQGMVYSPFQDTWSLSKDLDVNYLVSAAKRL